MLLLLAAAVSVTASELRVADGSVRPGEEIEIPVRLSDGNDQIAGLELELAYDTRNLDLAASPARGPLLVNKILTTSISPRRSMRLLLVGASRTPIPDGDVLILTITPKEGKTGSYPIRITYAKATSLADKDIPLTIRNGTLTASNEAKSAEEREIENLKSDRLKNERRK